MHTTHKVGEIRILICIFVFEQATGSSRGLSATETVLKYMEKLDEPPREEEPKSEGDLPSDDLDGSMESSV